MPKGLFQDLTGMKFGRWTVLGDKKSINKRTFWLCQCECESKTIRNVRQDSLIREETFSCGCWQKEVVSEIGKIYGKNNKKENNYIINGNIVSGFTDNGVEFIFDKKNFEKVKPHSWCQNNHGYIITFMDDKIIFLHNIVMDNLNSDMVVDHIKSKNILNNLESNLRICTNTENGRNKGLSKNNTSSVSGVYWNKNRNKWYSFVNIPKYIHLGAFSDFNDAVIARLKAEKQYFGEFAPQQHLYEQYGII